MLTVWLVLISLSNPNAPPEPVEGYKTMAECAAEANSGHNRAIMPLYRRTVPKGKAYLCMRYVYPT